MINAEAETSASIEGGASCAVDDVIDASAEVDADEDYVFARDRKMNSSLPSSKRLKEVFNNIMGALLLDTIGTIHLISDNLFVARAYPRTEKFDWSAWLDSLEKKGYLSAYEVDGETYYCVSPMLCGCLNKVERSKDLLEILNRFLYPALQSAKRGFFLRFSREKKRLQETHCLNIFHG